jgi:hypothetical protein
MVPPGMTALLNIHNVRPFLEEGKFLTTEQAKVGGCLGPAPPRVALRSWRRTGGVRQGQPSHYGRLLHV